TGSSSEAFSVAASGLCAAGRRAVHVCLARSLSIVLESRTRTRLSKIHESFGDHKFLADVSFCRSRHSVPFCLRFCHRLFFGAERLLHLRLSVRRFLRSC